MITDNQKQNVLYPKGSEWRKWDLHVHSPKTYGGSYDDFINNINNSEAEVIGINDYSTIEGYEKIISKYRDKVKKILFPVIEFRMNNILLDKDDPRLKKGIRFNFHIIFDNDPNLIPRIKTWLNSLECLNEKGKSDRIGNIEILDEKLSFDYFRVVGSIEKDDYLKNRHLVWLPYDEYGGIGDIDPEQDKYFKLGLISKAHIIGSSNAKQINFFVWKSDKYKEEEIKKWLNNRKIPCVKGSDAHKINYPFGKLKDENSQPIDKYYWIKADPTFEGLKQILYEPEPGDRVWIGPDVPDRKENYQIIKKIRFSNTNDFPEEIEFNQNLCSIIGGRSSGKSALLNYITHAIDPELVEKELEIKSAGEGEEYRWEKIKINYEVEWQDGFVSRGESKNSTKILYLPQNYLFKKSKDPDEIKRKIEPILFKKFPEFGRQYKKSIKEVGNLNKKITDLVEKWFQSTNLIIKSKERNKALGDKKAIEEEKQKIEQKIDEYKKKYSLSEDELKTYQDIRNKETELKSKIDQSEEGLKLIQSVLGEEGVFQDLKLELEPTLDLLPREFAEKVNSELIRNKKDVLESINKTACEYKENLAKNIRESKDELKKILDDNRSLLDKYKKNEELEKLVAKVNEYRDTLRIINNNENEIKLRGKELKDIKTKIKQFIQDREKIIKGLKDSINNLNQENSDIKFDIEYKIREKDESKVSQKINTRERTSFVQDHELQIKSIRENPDQLLQDIYSGNQKINSGYKKEEVVIELLTLTETILFVGKMEGDRIGGFSEITMTPGRRALFLLRLILAESDEKWPILIDQPEDNLDSKSITEEIVPFLKEKKKERQIIMVSHNANFVIGADSEQIIVANRNGSESLNQDGKQFNYLTGSIEYTKERDESIKDTLRSQGIREHACLILDGGKDAFEHRRNKYNIVN